MLQKCFKSRLMRKCTVVLRYSGWDILYWLINYKLTDRENIDTTRENAEQMTGCFVVHCFPLAFGVHSWNQSSPVRVCVCCYLCCSKLMFCDARPPCRVKTRLYLGLVAPPRRPRVMGAQLLQKKVLWTWLLTRPSIPWRRKPTLFDGDLWTTVKFKQSKHI